MKEAEAGGSKCILKDIFDVSDNLGKDGMRELIYKATAVFQKKTD